MEPKSGIVPSICSPYGVGGMLKHIKFPHQAKSTGGHRSYSAHYTTESLQGSTWRLLAAYSDMTDISTSGFPPAAAQSPNYCCPYLPVVLLAHRLLSPACLALHMDVATDRTDIAILLIGVVNPSTFSVQLILLGVLTVACDDLRC